MKVIAAIQLDTSKESKCISPDETGKKGSSRIELLIKTLSSIKRIEGVYIAMPDNPANRQFGDYFRSLGVTPFFGDIDNIASRLLALGLTHGAEAILRIPGTKPALDSKVIDKMIDKFLDEEADLCFDEISSKDGFYDLTRLAFIAKFLEYQKNEFVPGLHKRYYTWAFHSPFWGKAVSTAPEGLEKLCEEKNRIAWYHVIDLGNGISTRGDSNQQIQIDKRGIPKNLSGERVADIGSCDGYYAFESEKRGAGEVYSFDLPDGVLHDIGNGLAREILFEKRAAVEKIPANPHVMPTRKNEGFEFAHKTLNSKVIREYCSIYDLSKEKYGQFDRVYCFALLLHLIKPMLGLEKLSEICRGQLHINTFINNKHGNDPVMWFHETYHERSQKDLMTWWIPSVECLKQMLRTCGFKKIEILDVFGDGEIKDQVNLVASK